MNKRNFLYIYIGLVVALLLPEAVVAKALSYYFRTLGIEEGLSQSTVNVIIQDSRGFMWFGTKDGLNLYDGLVFRSFQKENSALGNNCITALYEDKGGDIWVGTDAGVYVYHPHTEEFSSFDVRIVSSDEPVRRAVTRIDADASGNIWISVDGQGLLCYEKETGTLHNEAARVASGSANITHFWFDKETMWVGRYEDNLYFSADRVSFQPFVDADGNQPFKGTSVGACVRGLHNCIYVGTTHGLMEVNLTTRNVRRLVSDYVRDLCFRSDTELWIGTEDGIYVYDFTADTSVHLTAPDSNDRYSLSDNAVYAVFKDRENGMWIGSYFGGINYYPYQYTYFEKYYPRNDSGMGRRVREFCDGKDGTIWIGTEDKGLFRLNSSEGSVTSFRHPLLSHNVHGLCLDDNYLWVGTFSGGLNRIDLRTQTVKHYAKGESENTLNADNVFSVCKTSTGDLWIGTTSGLLRYNRGTDDFLRISRLDGVFVYTMLEDSYGRLWLATYSDGVFCYTPSQREWRQYNWNPEDSTSLSYNKVIGIFEDSRRQLWFMTQGEGICRLRPETDDFVRYDMSDGFPGNIVYKMLEDDKGLLWVTTNKGLVSFQPETGIKHVYTTANGLLSNQFNYQSGYKDKEGTFYFGSIDGFVAFNPVSFKENTTISPLVLTDFFLFGKRQPVGRDGSPLSRSVTFLEEIKLKANQNSFSLRASVLSYQAPQLNKVLYKLEGFDKEWYVANGIDSRISYSNLPYGSYTLRVKGANSDGVWNPKERLLNIRVLPPFYLSTGAYLIYVFLLIAGIASSLFYFRRRNLRRHVRAMEILHYEKERELYAAKIDFFTNVAHEIRTPLTLIKSPLEHVLASNDVDESIKDDLEIMDLNTNRLLDLVNQLLDFRKTETKGFRLSFVTCNLSELLRKTYVRFTPLARERGLDLSVDIPEGIQAAVDKEGFTKIVSNLLTNAVKYADTYIRVALKTEAEKGEFYLSVTNDGIIIPLVMREEIFKPFIQYHDEASSQASAGTGIGLALARSLAELHGGTLAMDDDLSCNSFVLTLPLYQETSLHLEQADEDVAEADGSSEETPSAFASSLRYTLLVVEDNVEMRKYLMRQLSSSYKILTAANGVEALEVLQDSIVNLIVSDVMMPEMDGMELCDKVKTELDYSHIPVILLTAKTTLQSKIEGMKVGADAYVDKPFSVEYLKVCISSLLKSREQLQVAFAHAPFAPTNNIAISKADEEFLKKLNDMIQANMQNPDFGIVEMCELLCMSRSSLNRKIKGILDITPNDYIRIERLKKAAQLLRDGDCKINEVCYRVGFNTPSYFAKCFQKQFGVLPKDFIGK